MSDRSQVKGKAVPKEILFRNLLDCNNAKILNNNNNERLDRLYDMNYNEALNDFHERTCLFALESYVRDKFVKLKNR